MEAATAVHNISRAQLDTQGVAPEEGLKQFLDFMHGSVLVAHNLKYDQAMLAGNCQRRELKFDERDFATFDTLDLARRLHPSLKSYTLADLIEAFSIAGQNTHNAVDDVRATGLLMLRLRDDAVVMQDRQRQFFQRHAPILHRFVEGYQPIWDRFQSRLDVATSYRDEVDHLAAVLQRLGLADDGGEDGEPGSALTAPLEKFLRYTDAAFGRRPSGQLFGETRESVGRLKESDLMVGDERYIVSTIHKAKGLEFDCVVIPKCIDDVYPHYFSKRAANAAAAMAEDARLLYVALTRAKRQLIISWPSRKFGQAARREDKKTGLPIPDSGDARPSPFLKPVLEYFTVRRLGAR